jgi:23S rRNA pseudouridine1911/1915/1917 synthase
MKCLDKEILYLDNHILVAVKPSDLLTQPDESGSDNFQDRIKKYLQKKLNKKTIFLHVIHRLDKPVCGIVLFARSSKALSRLNEEMRQKKIKRIYYALVEGILDKKKGSLEHYLTHSRLKAKVFNKKEKDAKLAILSYLVLQEKDNKSFLEIELDTGRYHQIRAQFSFIGHPIVGDSKYGSKSFSKEIQLCHGKLEFYHPITKEKMIFEEKSFFNK